MYTAPTTRGDILGLGLDPCLSMCSWSWPRSWDHILAPTLERLAGNRLMSIYTTESWPWLFTLDLEMTSQISTVTGNMCSKLSNYNFLLTSVFTATHCIPAWYMPRHFCTSVWLSLSGVHNYDNGWAYCQTFLLSVSFIIHFLLAKHHNDIRRSSNTQDTILIYNFILFIMQL